MDPKPASASRSLIVHWMGVTDTNNAGFVHGGTVLKLADEVAGITAARHCGCRVVTGGLDRVTFLNPIDLGEVVTLSASFKRFDWRLDDAAKMLGASAFTRVRTVLLPLLAASLGSAFLFAFIVSFDDLTIAIFVSGGINTTLPKQMWDDIQLAVTPTLAAVATSLVFLMVFIVWLSSIFKRKSY